jgi:hypothetical protein
LPPYVSGLVPPLIFAPDGLLWVRRTAAANAPETFDVIDRNARVAERVVLPARRKLVGFGNGVIFAVRIDDDDLQYLERFPFRER